MVVYKLYDFDGSVDWHFGDKFRTWVANYKHIVRWDYETLGM